MDKFKTRIRVISQLQKFLDIDIKKIILLILIQIVLQISALIYPYLFKVIIDDIIVKHVFSQLYYVLFTYIIVFGFESIVTIVYKKKNSSMLLQFSQKLREKLWGNISDSQHTNLKKYSTGDLKTRIDSDVDIYEKFINEQFIDLLINIFVIFLTLTIMASINIKLSLLAVVLLFISFWISKRLETGLNYYSDQYRKLYSEYDTWLQTSFQSWKEIKFLSLYKKESERFFTYWNKIIKMFMKRQVYQYGHYFFVALKDLIITRFSLYIIGSYFIYTGEISIGDLVIFINYFEIFFANINDMILKNIKLANDLPSIERVDEILLWDIENVQLDISQIKDLIVKNVTFSFDTSTEQLLSDINFNVKKNEKVAIVGKSGCGKTTILNLLIGNYRPVTGKIFYNDYELLISNQKSIQKKIGVVPQDPILFNISIIDNLRLGNDEISEQEVYSMCSIVNMHDFIMNLDEGYNTLVGENGVKLSGGQKQRLAIVRALLHIPDLIFLDEITSSVDHVNESMIINHILTLERTVILVTHQLSIVRLMDKVIYISDGKIKQIDTHENLLNDDGYKKLFNI